MVYKKQIVTMAFALIIKAFNEQELTKEHKTHMIRDTFDILTQIKTEAPIDSKILGTLVLYGLEDQ